MKLNIGIDWSQSKHDVCFLNQAGVIQAQAVIEHSPAGFGEFEKLCQQWGGENRRLFHRIRNRP